MNFSFTLYKKKIIVTASLRGTKKASVFKFILDTGAGKTVLNEDMANILGYDKEDIKNENFVTAGGKVNGKIIKLQHVELFGKLIPNFEISIMKLPLQITLYADGLIGMDFLTKFKNFKIDFEDNIIEV